MQGSPRYSQHTITSTSEFTFNPTEYSQFKYGSHKIAVKFGTELARGFIESDLFQSICPKLRAGKQIVILCSPYGHVQSAAAVIAKHFLRILNLYLVTERLPVASEYKTTRDKFYTVDYASMDALQRKLLIFGDRFHISKSFLENKILIHIDDIRITGSHEEVVEQIITDNNLKETGAEPIFLYYAELGNPNISPSIEHDLNEYAIKNLNDISLLVDKDYEFNTRVIKYILSTPHRKFKGFLETVSKRFKDNLMHLAIGEGYCSIDQFKANLNYLIAHNITSLMIESLQ